MNSSRPSVANTTRESAHNLRKFWPQAVALLGVAIVAVSVCTPFVCARLSGSNGDWIFEYAIERQPIHWLIWAALGALSIGWCCLEKLTKIQIRLLSDSGICLAVALFGYGVDFGLSLRSAVQAQPIELEFGTRIGGFAYLLGCLLILWISFAFSSAIRKLEKTES